MVEIRLHGVLAKEFGMVWNLDIQTVPEAMSAIEANLKGFRRRVMELADKGMVYRVRSKNHDYGNEDVSATLGSIERIDIIPVVAGASAGLRFVIGAVLFVVGAFTSVFGGAGVPIAGLGLSLMVGSITEWLTPKPTKPEGQTALQSWTIGGPTNTVDQGLPVPIIYGEVLTGGYPISGGISVSQIANGTSGPSVAIGGTQDVADMTGKGGNFTSSLKLGCGPFNMDEPITYQWIQTGFSGAGAVRMTGSNTPAVEIQVDFINTLEDTITTYSGSVTVNVTGKNLDKSGDNVSATATVPVSVTIDAHQFQKAGEGGG